MAKKFQQNQAWYRCVQWLFRTLFRVFFGFRYSGVENIPLTGPVRGMFSTPE